ncbi:hypothetical protein [Lysinibacillus capsici]|uniref:hypothetical protein n=1 Tax=Lysinibacillus capsici TaxID=2115968 RepID=UPI002481107F|nr:hypothetical protein [Lysinibacillus capsici]
MVNRVGLIGSLLLTYSGINIILASIVILLNRSIGGYILTISFFITCLFCFFMIRKDSKLIKNLLINLAIVFLIIIGAVKLSTIVYDFSYDGQAYHQEALIQLKSGWNPLYEEVVIDQGSQGLWINHYAKGVWYLGTIVYDATGKIESAKAFNYIILISTLLILLSYLQRKLNRWGISILLSILMIFSPVVINQLFTNYNDFFIVLLLIILTIGYLNYYEKLDISSLITILFSIVLLVNIKFTALGYALVFTAIPILIILKNYYKPQLSHFNFKRKNIVSLGLLVVLAFFIGVALIGSTSYVKNTLTNGHPFYPLAGKGKVDIIGNNAPAAVKELNRVEKLYVSIFAESSNNIDTELKTKFPLSISEKEIFYSTATDTRIGGFGPLFGAIVILVFCLVLVNYREFNKGDLWYISIIVFAIMVSVFINPETWWARYIPQLWLVPLLAVILTLRSKIKSYIQHVILFVYIVNIGIVGYSSVDSLLEKQYMLNKQFQILKEYNKEAPVAVELGVFIANRERLEEKGIIFNKVENLEDCQNVLALTYSTAKACLDKPKK